MLQDSYARGSRVTLRDILVVCTQILVGMYDFELIYRVKIRLGFFPHFLLFFSTKISIMVGTVVDGKEKSRHRLVDSLNLSHPLAPGVQNVLAEHQIWLSSHFCNFLLAAFITKFSVTNI